MTPMNNTPAVPYNPQPIEVLQARYHLAVVKALDYLAIKVSEAPGLNPDNIFDFEDGLRILVNPVVLLNKKLIHFSAHTFGTFNRAAYTEEVFNDFVVCRFREISRDMRPVALKLKSVHGTPNFYIVDDGPNRNTFRKLEIT